MHFNAEVWATVYSDICGRIQLRLITARAKTYSANPQQTRRVVIGVPRRDALSGDAEPLQCQHEQLDELSGLQSCVNGSSQCVATMSPAHIIHFVLISFLIEVLFFLLLNFT